MSKVLWVIALVLIGMAFLEGATQGILAALGMVAIVFIWGAIFGSDGDNDF